VFNFLPCSLKTDIDDCASHPCKNNGSCTDRVNGFNCSCAPGFNGTQCETGNYSQNVFNLYHVLCGFNIFLSCLQCCIVSSNIVLILQWFFFVVAGFIQYDRLLTFLLISLKQISMIVQFIRVRTTGPAQTEWTNLTAAAHQDLMEHNVKQVTIVKTFSISVMFFAVSIFFLVVCSVVS